MEEQSRSLTRSQYRSINQAQALLFLQENIGFFVAPFVDPALFNSWASNQKLMIKMSGALKKALGIDSKQDEEQLARLAKELGFDGKIKKKPSEHEDAFYFSKKRNKNNKKRLIYAEEASKLRRAKTDPFKNALIDLNKGDKTKAVKLLASNPGLVYRLNSFEKTDKIMTLINSWYSSGQGPLAVRRQYDKKIKNTNRDKIIVRLKTAIKEADVVTDRRIISFFEKHGLSLTGEGDWNSKFYRDLDYAALVIAICKIPASKKKISVDDCNLINSKTTCTCVLPNGDIVIGYSDSTIGIWRPDEEGVYRCQQKLTGHKRSIKVLLHLPNGDIVSGSYDETIRIWRPNEKGVYHCQQILTGHEGWINALVHLPNGDIVSGSSDETIRIWRPNEKGFYNFQQRLTGLCTGGGYSEVYALLALPNGDFVSGATDTNNPICIWRRNARGVYRCQQKLIGQKWCVYALLYLPNGDIVSGYNAETICIWRQSAKGEYELRQKLKLPKEYAGSIGKIDTLLLLPNGSILTAMRGTIFVCSQNALGDFTYHAHLREEDSLTLSRCFLLNDGNLVSSKGTRMLGPFYLRSLRKALLKRDDQAIAKHLTIPSVSKLLASSASCVELVATPFEKTCRKMLYFANHPDMAELLFKHAQTYPALLSPVTGSLLHLATALNQDKWIKNYLEEHSDTLKNLPCNASGQNPLHVAVKHGFKNLSNLLREACPQWQKQADINGLKPNDVKSYAEMLGNSMEKITNQTVPDVIVEKNVNDKDNTLIKKTDTLKHISP